MNKESQKLAKKHVKKHASYVLAVYFVIWLTLVLLASCSPVKRLERLQNNHSYLFNRKLDTITVNDTILVTIPGIKIDTFFSILQLKKDTVFIEKNNLKTKLWMKNDTVFVDSGCDTVYQYVYREIKVPYVKNEAAVQKEKSLPEKISAAILLLAYLVGVMSFIIVVVRYFQGDRL